ncbi:cell wall anchor protein [Sorangium cellulosum]|uniref:Cell wall anchor protein n=1 Tax=Sorangium cellulosum TaxID=56 RepID=A0A150RKK3_SORCE|nr:cell wall anchor protein [Sorangium cellulosum]KYF93109.1 cell wall anchor protein [Sorangium cellulosum]
MFSRNLSARALLVASISLLGWAGCISVDHQDTDFDGDDADETGAADQPLSTVTFRSSSTATGKSLTALTLAKPAGVAQGDVLLARIAIRNQVGAVIAPPAGWTLLRSDQSASALKSWVLWKVASGAEPASYSFGFDVSAYLAGSIVAFSGADPASPIDAASGQKNGNSATLAAPPVTTTAANGVAVWFGTQVWTGSSCPASPIVPPSGFTEPLDTCLPSSSTGLLFDAAYKQLGAAGSQPAWSGASPFANTNTAQVVALRPAGAPSCSAGEPFASTYTTVGSLTSTAIVEISGLAASRVNPGILYAHSENNANFVAIQKTNAAVVGSYVAGVFPWDWEDIATGPCPAGSCIFMGDIGRFSGRPPPYPTTFAVVRMKEPNLAAGETSGTVSGDRFPFQYPDAPQNAEALMVHPTTRDIYVVTKEGTTGISKVYKFPSPLPAPDTLSTLIHVADLQMPLGPDENFRSVTAGTIHPCADRFLLRTYRAVYEYRAPAGAGFEAAFAAPPVALTDTVEGQGESIEYEADGSGYFTMTEREAAPYPLKRVARQ